MDSLIKLPAELNRERLLSTAQTAEFLGLSLPHLRRLYRAGRIPPPIRIGERKYGWKLSVLIDFVDSKSPTPA